MRILVAYFSRTGHTKQIAEALAKACRADREQIEEIDRRAGFFGYLRSAIQALMKQAGRIRRVVKDPSQYDVVILGTPVWAWNLSPPMRAYISEQASKFKAVGFFCTEGGAGGAGVFKQMSALSSKQPIATLIVTEAELKSSSYRDKLQAFALAIAQHSGKPHAGADTQTGP